MSCQHSHHVFDKEKFDKEFRAGSFLATLSLRLARLKNDTDNDTDVRLLVRIYSGGETTKAATDVLAALTELAANRAMQLKIETKNTDQLKNTGWSELQFVEWLLGSDVHFVLGYLSCNLDRLGWDHGEGKCDLMG